MKQLFVSLLLLALAGPAALLFAGGEPEAAGSGKQFGPYEALTFDASILRDVKYVPEADELYLQLLPEHAEKELTVKLSNDYFASYRQWHHGGYELVSPANQGKTPYGWTDWITTSAPYVEYWMDGEVFLHLRRVE